MIYLVKQYGLLAIIVLSLLIWLSQQNASDNSIRPGSPDKQQSGVYNHRERLDKDSQLLQQDWNPSKLLETERQPSHSSEYHASSGNASQNVSVNSEVLLDASIKRKGRPRSQDLFVRSDSDDRFVHEERSINYSVGVLNKDSKRSSITDDVIELDRQSIVELGVRNSSDKNISDTGKKETAANNGSDSYKTAARFPVQIPVEYRQARPFKPPVFDDSAASSRTEPQSVPKTNNHDQPVNFNFVLPRVKPVTTRQRISSDDDADGSLVLARQLALKNFVKTDEKHPSADQPDDINTASRVNDILSVTINQRNQYKRLFENIPVTNPAVDRGRKAWKQELDELEKFAEVPAALPDYDLPMLKDKSPPTEGRVTSTSTTRSADLVRGGISAVNYLVSNKTVDEDIGVKLDDDEVLADTDDVMSSAVVLGEVNPNKTYAVFSTTTENRDALNFIFLLPLTALAWKRVGFDSIIVIVGPIDVWNSDELYHFILSAVRQLDAVVVFLEPRPEKSVMISQVDYSLLCDPPMYYRGPRYALHSVCPSCPALHELNML